ncbi:T6SS effector BTH_I2691 family protein [Massilia arenae]|uniref:T6SS effector BTH_I2691 family protein n=1 Tax=Massilia arenae TaxID=2603288 RepID=UPI0028059006|nr:T6SS effector BTH_I2691 family protein [Massilia arenae]
MSASLGHVLSESTRNKTSKVREVTADELDRATASAWSKYDRKFDDTARQRWRVQFDAKLKAFDQQSIAPLALRHVEWFKSATFTDYFEFNYDPSNALCGVAYTNVVTSCLAGTQDKACCNKLYVELLQGNFQDRKNVLLRASILNQSAVAESIEESSKIALDSRQIPWDSLFEVYKAAMEALDDNSKNGLALYIAQISGPVARILGKVVDGRPGFHKALMMLGFISGDAVTVFEVRGKRSQFVRYLAKQMIRTSGAVISENQLRVAVSLELERLRIRGMRVEGCRKLRWVVSADSASIENLPGGMSRVAQEAQLKSSLRSVEQLESLRLERWRSIINQKVRWGVVTAILQTVCLTKLYEDEETSLSNERLDARLRRMAAIGGLVGTTSEVISNALESRARQGLCFGQKFASLTARALMFIGKGAGLAAGLIFAVLDVVKIGQVISENGSGLLAVAYAISAGLGLSMTVAVLFGAAFPITLALAVLLVAIGILIEFFKDDSLQDWLERCPWGVLPDQRYSNIKIEQEQFTQAFKGVYS